MIIMRLLAILGDHVHAFCGKYMGHNGVLVIHSNLYINCGGHVRSVCLLYMYSIFGSDTSGAFGTSFLAMSACSIGELSWCHMS